MLAQGESAIEFKLLAFIISASHSLLFVKRRFLELAAVVERCCVIKGTLQDCVL